MARSREQNQRMRDERREQIFEAALELFADRGLAATKITDIARRAGISQGLLYHYFGSRRELLRAAIARRFEAMAEHVVADSRGLSFVERRLRTFQSSATIHDSQLRALLGIDGDDTVDPMPRYEEMLSRLRQDVIDGDIDRGHDLEALQVALSALIRGYRIFREQYAKRIDTDAGDLDERVAEIVRAWLEAMAGPPAASQRDDGS